MAGAAILIIDDIRPIIGAGLLGRRHHRVGDRLEAELHVFEAMPHGGFMGAPEDQELAHEVRRFVADQWRPNG